jgi:hypothetical protein
MTPQGLTLNMRVDLGWRLRLLARYTGIVGYLPEFILDPLVAWAVRGIRVAAAKA